MPNILHRRNSSYPNKCHICQQESNSLHWIFCLFSEPLFNLIRNSLEHILSYNKLQISHFQAHNLHTSILNLDSFQAHQLIHKPSLASTLSGLILIDIINTLSKYTTFSKTAISLTIKLLLEINCQIYKTL